MICWGYDQEYSWFWAGGKWGQDVLFVQDIILKQQIYTTDHINIILKLKCTLSQLNYEIRV